MIRRAGLSLALVACTHAAPRPPPAPRPAAAPPPPAPRFCPDGTEQVGAEPPAGESIWCVRPDQSKHGPYRAWYENGQLEAKGDYNQGDRVGRWQFWDQAGTLLESKYYKRRTTLTLCLYDKPSRRAIASGKVWVSSRGPRSGQMVKTDVRGTAKVRVDMGPVEMLVDGARRGMWPKGVDASLMTEVPIGLDQPEVAMVLGTGASLGGPSPCAPP